MVLDSPKGNDLDQGKCMRSPLSNGMRFATARVMPCQIDLTLF